MREEARMGKLERAKRGVMLTMHWGFLWGTHSTCVGVCACVGTHAGV